MTREQRIALAVIPWFGRRRGLGGLDGGADLGEFGRPAGVRQEAEVADAAEALGQDMQQETADELAGVERHRFALVAGAVVLPAEADAPILAREQTAVGEGDPGACSGRDSREPAGARRTVAWHRRPIRRCAAVGYARQTWTAREASRDG